MNNKYLQVAVLLVLAALALFVIKRKPQMPTPQPQDSTVTHEEEDTLEPEVMVDLPKYGDLVASPLKISGKARGFWFFEANLPVVLKDQNGKVLVQKGLQATSNWMTTDFVPFEGQLEFAAPTTEFGVLIIQKDNPSGDPKFDASFAVPVRFK